MQLLQVASETEVIEVLSLDHIDKLIVPENINKTPGSYIVDMIPKLRVESLHHNSITDQPLHAEPGFLEALEQNVYIEVYDSPNLHNHCSKEMIAYILNLNRGGRRFLKHDDSTNKPALWPLVLDRANRLHRGLYYNLTDEEDKDAVGIDVIFGLL